MAKITDDELLSICMGEIENSTGYTSGELSRERAEAMDRYLGEPYGDEVEGRSQFLTREVLETIEGIMPSLIRIFTETDNIVEFLPTGPEDEAQAEQETDTVSYIWSVKNRSFFCLYTFLKDALLSKTGVMKAWAEKDEDKEQEDYRNLTEFEFGQLMADDEYEREVTAYDINEQGGIDVTVTATRKKTDIKICAVPPEEFGVNGDSRSPYAKDSQFCFQRTRKSYTELIAEGYDREFLESLPQNDDIETEERLARRNLTDESDLLSWATHLSTRMFWITECYLSIDRNDTGVAVLLRVTIAAGAYSGSGGRLMDVEEVDTIPFSTAPPIMLTHKFYGLSIADLITDIQMQNTTLMRSVFDNTFLANAGTTAVNTDFVNEDDLLTKRPGGLVRFEGNQPWNAVVGPIPHNQLPQQTYDLFERLDERQKRRTGYGDDVMGLDGAALSNVNTGVAAMAFEASRSKIELIARIIAEVAFKPLFNDIRTLLMKNQDKEMVIKLRGEWVPVNPSEWRTRENSQVQVGIGNVSRERRIMGYEAIMARQDQDMQMGAMGSMLMPENLYETRKRWVKAWGFEPSLYYTDPRMAPPQQPQQDPNADALMLQAQSMMVEAQTKKERNQIDMAKAQADVQLQVREQDLKMQEQELKAEIQAMNMKMQNMQNDTATDTKVASLELQMEKQETENRIKQLQMALDANQAERDRQVDIYKIQMDNMAKLMQSHGITQDNGEREEREAMEAGEKAEMRNWVGQLVAQNQVLAERLEELNAKTTAPKVIKRDDKGLMVQFGDMPVSRDASGRITQVG